MGYTVKRFGHRQFRHDITSVGQALVGQALFGHAKLDAVFTTSRSCMMVRQATSSSKHRYSPC